MVREAWQSKRPFEVVAYSSEGVRGTFLQIKCSHPGCTAVEHVNITHTTLKPATVNVYFRRKGWSVGHLRKSDMCPDHKPSRKERKLKLPMEGKLLNITPPLPTDLKLVGETKSYAPIPPLRAQTREDKRKIMDNLQTHYGDEGYIAHASDAWLAKSLDVPRAWVSSIREEFFGPDISEMSVAVRNDVDKLIERAHLLEERGMNLAAEGEKLRIEAERLSNLVRKREAA